MNTNVSVVLGQIRVLEQSGDLTPHEASRARTLAEDISKRLVDDTLDPAALKREIEALVFTGRPPLGRGDVAFAAKDLERVARVTAQITDLKANLAESLRILSEEAGALPAKTFESALAAMDAGNYRLGADKLGDLFAPLQRRFEESPTAANALELGEAYRLAAYAHSQLDNWEQERDCARAALAAYDRTLELSPNAAQTWSGRFGLLAVSRAANDRYFDVRALVSELLDTATSAVAIHKVAFAATFIGEHEAADRAYARLIAAHPQHLQAQPEVMLDAAWSCMRSGNWVQAAAYARDYGTANPGKMDGYAVEGYIDGYLFRKALQGGFELSGMSFMVGAFGSVADLEARAKSGPPAQLGALALACYAAGDLEGMKRHGRAYLAAAPVDPAAHRMGGYLSALEQFGGLDLIRNIR